MNHERRPLVLWRKAAGILVFATAFILWPVGCGRHDTVALQPEATLDELNSATSAWLMMKGKLPKSADELTNVPSLKAKRLPPPPPGKKLAIDPHTQQVVLIDE